MHKVVVFYIPKRLQKHAPCTSMHKHAPQACINMHCTNMHKHAQTHKYMQKHAQTCNNMHKHAQTCTKSVLSLHSQLLRVRLL
jgi:hypothetical protein